jgi:MFS transporter, DHA1 family, solute carrier family 18 (vesicular amine transporter), member 1/2
MALTRRSRDAASGSVGQPDARSRVIVGVVAFSLFVDYFLYGVVMTLLAHSPSKITGETQLGLLYGAYAVSVLLMTPLFGYLGDRIGGRTTVICGAVLGACATALFGAAGNSATLFAARLCQGAASAGVWTAGLALVAEYYVHNRVEMIGYAFTGSTAGSVLGPLIGGVLYRSGGYRLPFVTTGTLAAAAICLMLFFLPRQPSTRRGTIDIHALLTNRSVALSALAVALAAFAWGVIEPLLPLRLGRYGIRPETLGLMFTASSVTYGFCAPLVGWVCGRLPVRKVIVLGTIAMAAALPLLGAFHQIVVTGVALCLINCTFAFMLNPASAELGNEVDRNGMASYCAAYAVYNIVYSVGMLATTVVTSAAVRSLGFFGALLCVSGVLLASTPLLMLPDRATANQVEELSRHRT